MIKIRETKTRYMEHETVLEIQRRENEKGNFEIVGAKLYTSYCEDIRLTLNDLRALQEIFKYTTDLIG